MSEDPEDRAKKLQGRFSTSEADEADGTDEASGASDTSDTSDAPGTSGASNTSNTSEADEASGTGEASDTVPLRDRPKKLLYLDDDLKKELELAFDELNLRYKRERDEELHQNDDWWPVLLRVGYEAIGDVSEVDLEQFDRAREGELSVTDQGPGQE